MGLDPSPRIVSHEARGRGPRPRVATTWSDRATGWLAAVAIVTSCVGCSADVEGKHLFVLAGQSNMARLDPAISFVPAVAEALGAERVIVVKDAFASLPIQSWDRGWQLPESEVEARKLSPTIHQWEEDFDRNDRDASGEISFAELAGSRLADWSPSEFSRLDANGNGGLSREEFLAHPAYRRRFAVSLYLLTEAGARYEHLLSKLREATEGEVLASATLVWMQGESDAEFGWFDVYEAALRRVHSQLASDLEREDLNLVVGRISDFDLGDEKYPDWSRMRQIQEQVADSSPFFDWVDTDDLNVEEGADEFEAVHYTQRGYRLLGERFARSALALIEKRRACAEGTGPCS